MYIVSEFYPSRPVNSDRKEDIRANRQAACFGTLYEASAFKRGHLTKDSVLSPVQQGELPAVESVKGKADCSAMLDKYGELAGFQILELRNWGFNVFRMEECTEISYIACFKVRT